MLCLTLAVQENDSVIHIYIFSYSFLYGLLLDIEYSSLRYTVQPCCLSTVYNSLPLLIPINEFFELDNGGDNILKMLNSATVSLCI